MSLNRALDKRVRADNKISRNDTGEFRLGSDADGAVLDKAIAGLLGDYGKLGARLRIFQHDTECELSGLTLRFQYPAFRGGQPTDTDLTDLIAHYITKFALPHSVRNRVHRKFKELSPEEVELECSKLRAKAVDTFIRAHKATKRNGEAGELMLFLLTEWILGAPQILAKMSLKTNPDFPVLGADGLHVKVDSETGKIHLYFGESKLHKSLTGGINSAAQSIRKGLRPSEAKYEVELIEKFVELSGLPESSHDALLAFLDPWEEVSNTRVDVITCLIAFEFSAYSRLKATGHVERVAEFEAAMGRLVSDVSPKVVKAFSEVGLQHQEVELFLLPLPSVAVLREQFQALIGWKP